MSMTRFATECDHCGARSPEYTAWPSCTECLYDTCPGCSAEDLEEQDGMKTCICKSCEAEQLTGSIFEELL